MIRLRAAVVAAAVLWPLTLGAAMAGKHGGERFWSSAVYVAAGQICHQQPSRSFRTPAGPWPVCARCSGLYLAAPLGALLAWSRKDFRRLRSRSLPLVILAAVPTAATLTVEWLGLAPVSNLARALAALPLGGAVAFVIVAVLAEPSLPIKYTGGR